MFAKSYENVSSSHKPRQAIIHSDPLALCISIGCSQKCLSRILLVGPPQQLLQAYYRCYLKRGNSIQSWTAKCIARLRQTAVSKTDLKNNNSKKTTNPHRLIQYLYINSQCQKKKDNQLTLGLHGYAIKIHTFIHTYMI